MAKRISVVLSQGQSNNPDKRHREETIVAELMMASGVDVLVIPHLYDLRGEGTAILALQGLRSDFVLLSWLYRACRTLDTRPPRYPRSDGRNRPEVGLGRAEAEVGQADRELPSRGRNAPRPR